jgi:hypothetical protein
MDYNNVTYPLDKIFSKATGVSYPVCAAGHDNAQPTPDPEPTPGELGQIVFVEVENKVGFDATMQCTGPMDNTKSYSFNGYSDDEDHLVFMIRMLVDPEDNTKLILDLVNDYDIVMWFSELVEGNNTGYTEPCSIIDRTDWSEEEGPSVNWTFPIEGEPGKYEPE